MEDLITTELTNYLNYTLTSNYTIEPNGTGPVGSGLNVPYATSEILVAVSAVFGNGLVIVVFARERRLRRRTNYYIISLATADLLVGLFAIPFAILASVGLPTNFHACLFTVSVLVVLCTISIFCLVAVSVDRYWAILYPMGYSRTVRTKTAVGKIRRGEIVSKIRYVSCRIYIRSGIRLMVQRDRVSTGFGERFKTVRRDTTFGHISL